MTRLQVSYADGVAESDIQEQMSDEEFAIAMALQDAKLKDGRKYSPGQPRDRLGQFGESIGLDPTAATLGNQAVRTGGFSISTAGDNPDSGWMVSQAGTERSFTIDELATSQSMGSEPAGNPWEGNVSNEIERFLTDNRGDLEKPGAYLGGWVDNDSGRLYLDVSHNIESKEEAVKYADEGNQLAMFNAGTGEYVEFDRSATRAASRGKSIGAPQFRNREKVFLEVGPESTADELTAKLLAALTE